MTDIGGVSSDQLRSIVERIERLEEEKKGIGDDIRDIYAEAKGNGFDSKIIRQIIKRRKMEPNERQEQEELLDLYETALANAGQGNAVERAARSMAEGSAPSTRSMAAAIDHGDDVVSEPPDDFMKTVTEDQFIGADKECAIWFSSDIGRNGAVAIEHIFDGLRVISRIPVSVAITQDEMWSILKAWLSTTDRHVWSEDETAAFLKTLRVGEG